MISTILLPVLCVGVVGMTAAIMMAVVQIQLHVGGSAFSSAFCHQSYLEGRVLVTLQWKKQSPQISTKLPNKSVQKNTQIQAHKIPYLSPC